MSWSWKLGRIAAIDVYVHFTFFLLLGWEALRDYQAHGDTVEPKFLPRKGPSGCDSHC